MKIQTLFLSTFVFLLLTVNSIAQTAPEIEWQNTIGGSDIDELYSIRQTADGGYILGGFSSSGISGDKTETNVSVTQPHTTDYWIVKTNATGDIEWQNTIGGSSYDFLRSINQTTDGGYILGGYSSSDISGDKTENSVGSSSDFWIVKVDSSGEIEWDNTIFANATDELFSIEQTSDGGYILGGTSSSDNGPEKTENAYGDDYWVIKLDVAGDIEWQNTIRGSGEDWLRTIKQTADGGYIIGGSSYSDISGDKSENTNGFSDYWVVKINASGDIEWQNTLGGSSYEYLLAVQQTSDGGYILGGSSNSGISGDKTESLTGLSDSWIIKLDAFGEIEWQNTISGGDDDVVFSIQQTTDDGYILGGTTDSDMSSVFEQNYYIAKLDSAGEIVWQDTLGGISYEFLQSVQQTSDGGYILGGYSGSGISVDKTEASLGYSDYWIIKLAPDVCTVSSAITPSGPTTFCAGSNVTLDAPLDGSYSYQWKKNGVNIPGATASSYTANTTGQYQVYISNGSCNNISDSVSVVKNPKPNPAVINLDTTNDICFDASIKLKTANLPGASFQWYNGTSLISGATSNIYFASAAGNYKVKVTNSFGCSKASAVYNIIETCRQAALTSEASIELYPNPAGSILNIETNNFREYLTVEVFTVLGVKVMEKEFSEFENLQLNITELVSGIYTLVLSNNEQRATEKFVKE